MSPTVKANVMPEFSRCTGVSMLKVIMMATTFMAAMPLPAVAAASNGGGIKVKVTAGEHVLMATFVDNATTMALIARFPLTVPMMDLYSRELVYRFPDALPADEARTSGYEVGDIVYWTPRHSFVIMYEQNGERTSNLQMVGRIDSGVEVFRRTGDIDVTFELVNDWPYPSESSVRTGDRTAFTPGRSPIEARRNSHA